MRRPVLSACSVRRSSSAAASPATSMYWPPTMPWTPVAAAISPSAASTRVAAAGLARQDEVERLREEAVAGQDGHVLAEGDVARGPAAAQRVVVDRRQVVVDERVRVDELERRRGGQHAGAGRRPRPRAVASVEHRPDALAAGEQRVAHRLGQPGRAAVGAEVERGEIVLDEVEQVGRIPGRRAWELTAAALPGDAAELLQQPPRLFDLLRGALQQRHLDLGGRRRGQPGLELLELAEDLLEAGQRLRPRQLGARRALRQASPSSCSVSPARRARSRRARR